MRANRLRELWASGGAAVNGWLSMPGSYGAEVMAQQGWDCITVDMQHAPVGLGDLVPMLQAISTREAVPMVRVPWNEPSILMRALDAGAYGIICPMVNGRDDVERLVAACRYPPDGIRSNGPYRGLMYGGGDYQQHANAEIVLFAMIETREGVENLAEIAATPGLDGVFIGPTDLAMSHGHPPKHDNVDGPVADLIARIREGAHAAGKLAGVHATRTDYAAKMIEDGFDLVTPSSDVRMIAVGGAEVIRELKG